MRKQDRKAPEFNLLNRTVKVHLTQGAFTVVDFDSYELIKDRLWRLSSKGYAVSKFPDGTDILMHRLIMKTPSRFETDHIDGDKLNNTRNNLRIVTRSENKRNTIRKYCSTGIIGVSWDKRASKWIAKICKDKRQITLGRFVNFTDAVISRAEAERAYFGNQGPIGSRPGYKALVDFAIRTRCDNNTTLQMYHRLIEDEQFKRAA